MRVEASNTQQLRDGQPGNKLWQMQHRRDLGGVVSLGWEGRVSRRWAQFAPTVSENPYA